MLDEKISWLEQSWITKPSQVFNWVRGNTAKPQYMFRKPNGDITANLLEFNALVSKAWLPVFQKYLNEPEPDWNKFREIYERHIPCHPMTISDIHGTELRTILSRMQGGSACGMDGWRVVELKLLPLPLLNALADMLNFFEELDWMISCKSSQSREMTGASGGTMIGGLRFSAERAPYCRLLP